MITLINYKGIDFYVTYEYEAEESAVNYSDGSGHPGSAERVNLLSVRHKGVEFKPLLEDSIEDIEGLVLDEIKLQNEEIW
jgi:hypothetical protein